MLHFLKKHWELLFLSSFNLFIPLFLQLYWNQSIEIIFYALGLLNFISYYLVLKKNISGVYIYLLCLCISIYLDYHANIYGDLILRLVYIMPLQFIVIKNFKKAASEGASINYIGWNSTKQMRNTIILTILSIIVISLNLNFINKIPVFNLIFKKDDPYIILDAISVVCNIVAQYQFSRRNYHWFGFNIFADIPLLFIWLFEVMFKHNSGAIVLVLGNFSYAVVSICGYYYELRDAKKRVNI